MKIEIKDNCPSCNVPWADHLGIQGLCRELQESKKGKDVAIQDWCEMDTEIKAITTKCGVSDHTGVPGYGFKSAEDCVQELADKWLALQAEVQRLRAALEQAKEKMDRARYIVTNCHPTNLLPTLQTEWIDAALSPSAPAKQEVSKGEWREAAEQAWRKLPHRARGSEPTLNFLQGFQFGWNHPIRRFHPATTNQEDV